MTTNSWTTKTLEHIAKISSGGTPRRDMENYWNGNIPWVTTAEVNFSEITDSKEKITDLGLKNSSAKLYQRGTILMAMYGQGKTRGQVGILGIEAATNQACAAIVLKKGFDPEFYFQYLQSRYERIRIMSNSGGQDNLSAALVKEIPVPVLPLSEQIRIAKILNTWDLAIITTEKLIKNSKLLKKSTAKQLITGDIKIPGFKENWRLFELGDIFKERLETKNSDLPLLSITSEEGVIDREDVGRKDTSNADKSKYLRICPGDIGYNTMRMWQGVSGLSSLEGLVSPAYTVLKPQAEIYPLYASYLFKLPALIHIFYRHSQGMVSDTWNLKYSNFSRIKWKFPCFEEQKKIATILATIDSEIKTLQLKLTCLKQEKRSLMQTIFSGPLRVTVDVLS